MYKSVCDTDVFVCGGGPAGLAAAIAARVAGFRVTVADPAQPPIDKACGEGIMPDGLAALEKIGITLRVSDGAPFSGIRFSETGAEVEACFPQGRGIGVRRTVLHNMLVSRAAEVGVTMHWSVRVTGLTPGGVSINGQTVRSRFVVCADGQQSRLRDLAGFVPANTVRRRYGFRRHYRVKPWSRWVEIYWCDLGQMYVTPVAPDEVCVALITRHSELRFDQALPLFPELSGRLAGAEFTREKGAVTATRKIERVQCNRVALIGEASGSVDAITGEGLALAFRQAIALVDAMQRDNLAGYEKAHRRMMRLPRAMAELMLAMDKHPQFRRRVMRALSAEPSLFARLLEIHTGARLPYQFGVRGTLSLGWRVLTA